MAERGPKGPDQTTPRGEAHGPAGPAPVEPADTQEVGLRELQRAILSTSLGVLLGTVLAELGRRARRGLSA